jgi:hypothetical protein
VSSPPVDEVDGRQPRRTSRTRTGIALIAVGVLAVVVCGAMAYVAAIWGFMSMDNQPADPPYFVLWDIGRIGPGDRCRFAVVGCALAAIGSLSSRIRRSA